VPLNIDKLYETLYITILLVFILTFSHSLEAQSYGLQFKGINESLDNRTQLDLNPEGYFTFQNEFEISFDYKISRSKADSNIGLFGYIVRIINGDNVNVDLLSSITYPNRGLYLNVVLGKLDSIVQTKYPEIAIDSWIRLRLKFNLDKDQMIFYTPDTFYVHEDIGFKKNDDFKILFGANNFGRFRTSDVPTMSIKDLKIIEKGKLRYHWLLDEKRNNKATDRLTGQKAVVLNPTWLNFGHDIWQLVFDEEMNGRGMIASDPENGKIYLIGANELLIYSTQDDNTERMTLKNRPLFPSREAKSIFNSLDNKIYCYLVNDNPPYILDPHTGIWEHTDTSPIKASMKHSNRYYNHYFDTSENSIYTFGGYGQFQYNNEIRKKNLTNNSLINLPTDNKVFHPKYLSGLGSLNDTIYILGGYGNKTGNQLINPRSYYDLIGYSIREGSLFKKFEIPHIIHDMCIANAMWIDKDNRDYYALIFEKSIFDGNLQMVKGNLESSDIDMVGSEIPYKFVDINSNAGLIHMDGQNKLFAYTMFVNDSGKTNIKIYSINYPPSTLVVEPELTSGTSRFFSLIIIVSSIFLFGLAFIFVKKRTRNATIHANGAEAQILNEDLLIEQEDLITKKTEYQLIFFGGFQVIDKKSQDITTGFSRLLKELFLLILLHTYKNNKGISTEKLKELLWPKKSVKNAQNNRAVNLARLRTILSEIGVFEISKKTGYWKCVFNESEIKSDYIDFLNLTSSKTNLTKQKIIHLIEITKRGDFLHNIKYDWLDEFKAKVSDTTIDFMVYFANQCDIKKEADFIIHLADSIFIFDDTNEDAMILKCRAQYILNKHGSAEETYKKFFKEYREMYAKEYEQSFFDIVKNDD
jgi:two-component SAPR family response regulator